MVVGMCESSSIVDEVLLHCYKILYGEFSVYRSDGNIIYK